MYQDDEEIYDDTSEVMTESTGLSAIRSRFEDAQKQFGSTPSTRPKPVISSKPKVLPKYGGGTGLNICSASEKKDENIPNALKCRNGGNTDNDSNGAVQKRDSKVNIPGAFLKNKDAPPVEHKLNPDIKPSKGDANNNADVNGITSSGRFNKLETALKQKTPGIVGGRKPSSSETSVTGKVSPRGKPSDASIPIDSGSSVGSARSKSPRGTVTGIGILAQMAAMPGDSNTPVDLRSRLKHVDATKNNPKPTVPLPSKKLAFNITSTNQKDVPWRKNLRSAKSRESTTQIQSVIRMFDGKKFHRVKDSSLGEDNASDKPDRLDFDIDIDALELDYKEALEHIDEKEQKAHGWTEVIEDIDEDGKLHPISKRAVSLIIFKGKRPKPKPRKSMKQVALIQPMTEDEEHNEEQWNQADFNGLTDSTNDLPAPPAEMLDEQETYDDVAVPAMVPPPDEDLEEDEMYEELPEEGQPPPPVGPKPSEKPPEVPSSPLPKSPLVDKSEPELTPEPTPENSKEQKRLEKERKKKEKEEKKLLEKKEKEVKNLLKVLGVKAEVLTTTVGKGKVKRNVKGKKAGELTVSEGEQVDIIRMIDNPAGKWLVRIIGSQKVGYCDEKNVEVDTSSILNFMTGSGRPKSSTSSTPGGEEQETYEVVDGAVELTEDEIYEECN